MIVWCPRCNNLVAQGDKFCGSCGSPITQAAPPSPTEQESAQLGQSGQPNPRVSPNSGQPRYGQEYQLRGSPMPGFGNEPIPELSNPSDPIRVGDLKSED